MIIRGAFFVGMAWLCLPHLHGAQGAMGSAQLQQAALTRLADMKDEIRDNSRSPAVAYAASVGENMRGVVKLLPGPQDTAMLLNNLADANAQPTQR